MNDINNREKKPIKYFEKYQDTITQTSALLSQR